MAIPRHTPVNTLVIFLIARPRTTVRNREGRRRGSILAGSAPGTSPSHKHLGRLPTPLRELYAYAPTAPRTFTGSEDPHPDILMGSYAQHVRAHRCCPGGKFRGEGAEVELYVFTCSTKTKLILCPFPISRPWSIFQKRPTKALQACSARLVEGVEIRSVLLWILNVDVLSLYTGDEWYKMSRAYSI